MIMGCGVFLPEVVFDHGQLHVVLRMSESYMKILIHKKWLGNLLS